MLTLSPATQEAAERREVGEPPAGVCQGLDPASEPGPLTTWGLRAALGLEEARRPPASPVLSRRDPALLLRLALLSAVASLCHPSLPPFTFDLKQRMSYFIPERTLLGAGGRDLGKPPVQAVRRKERPRRAERWRLSRVKADEQESRSDDLRAQRRQS